MNSLDQGAFYFFWVRAVVLTVEVLILLRKKGRNSDVIPNIVCGVVIFAFLKLAGSGITLGFMVFIASFGRDTLAFSWWLLLLTIIAVDFGYYIAHFLSHKVRFMWADHSVHHSSREFDFSTALRGSFINGVYSWLPVAPLLLLGVSPLLVVWCRALVNDYTFFLHTRYIGKLGWLEWVLNTPSHHRVHHASNGCYIDKNFGFLLIIWDRLFGTFASEREDCIYGTGTPPTRNPVRVIFDGWISLWHDLAQAESWRERTKLFCRTRRRSMMIGRNIG